MVSETRSHIMLDSKEMEMHMLHDRLDESWPKSRLLARITRATGQNKSNMTKNVSWDEKPKESVEFGTFPTGNYQWEPLETKERYQIN